MPVQLDPTEQAERLLESVWVSIMGERYIPVDPIAIGRRMGIDVFAAELPPNMLGTISYQPGVSEPTIIINRNDPPNRARFTCAHEIGHFVSHAGDKPVAFTDYRGPLAATGQDPEEVFANQFAAALLMPEKEIREHLGSGATPSELAFLFQVSAEAMAFRLKNLRINA